MDQPSKNSTIQKEILELISRFGWWMITKNGVQGCAGYVHTPNRKLYMEILFPEDYPNRPIIMNLPRDIRQQANLYEFIPQIIQKTVDPQIRAVHAVESIMSRISTLKVKESLLDELDEEFNLVKAIYNAKTVEGKKYHIRIFYQLESQLNFEFEINYKNYPQKPEIIYHQQLEKILGSPQSLQTLRNWNTHNPPHIVQIVQEIEERFTSEHGIKDIEKLLVIKNLSLINEKNQIVTKNVSFSAMKGDIIGIYCLNKEIPLAIFNAFLGKAMKIEGEINLFGERDILKVQEKIKLIDFDLPPKTIDNLKNKTLENILYKYGINLQKKDMKERINSLLSIIGLSNRRKLKMEDLSDGEKRRLIFAFSAITQPSIILLVEPENGLNTTEKKRMWDAISAINDIISSTIFVYSKSDELRRCHNILVLSEDGKQLGFGTLTQLIGELPLHEKVIVVQLNSPNPDHVEALGKLPGITFLIEEREEEKYRIFTKLDPNAVIPHIFQQIGSNIYNISKEIPSLIDYVPYKRSLK